MFLSHKKRVAPHELALKLLKAAILELDLPNVAEVAKIPVDQRRPREPGVHAAVGVNSHGLMICCIFLTAAVHDFSPG
jgi:hypothetical protein